ncbi:MAG: tetratricopeptide repeat protein [Sphingobacteriaceae bacterium]|nr:tetratricopeptide repeat protein [Sphingobacteriaceae bacterium]
MSKLYENENPKKALQFINQSLIFWQKQGYINYPFDIMHLKAQIFRGIGQIDSSIHYCNLVLNRAIQEKNYQIEYNIYSELGLIANSQDNFNKAIHFHTKQLELIKQNKVNDNSASVYNNLGIAYAGKGDKEIAFEYFIRALRFDLEKNNIINVGNDYNNLGVIYIMNKHQDSALVNFERGLKYRIKANDLLGIGGSLNNLAFFYAEKGNYNKAINLADSAMKIATSRGFKKLEIEILQTYNEIYLKKQDYKMAYEWLQKFNKERQKLNSEELSNKVSQLESDITLGEKQAELLKKDLELEKSEKQKQKQLGGLVLSMLFLFTALFFVFNFKKNNRLLKSRNELISQQKNIIEEKHRDITDSINYAQKIQNALLINENILRKSLPNSFILYKPRDIVSGDFYWYTFKNNRHILALADCTGHGVPGAFMSMIGMTLLDKIVNEKNILSPALILNELRNDVIQALNLHNDGDGQRDGMDMSVISIQENELTYAGANAKAFIFTNNNVTELIPNKQPIGLFEKNEKYSEQIIAIQKGMKLYLFSDGIIDQFGNLEDKPAQDLQAGKKVKSKLFKQWITETVNLSMPEQKTEIEQKLILWKKGFEQTDDISLIGIQLS